MTMYRTTARGKTVVKVRIKFTLFRVIVKSNFGSNYDFAEEKEARREDTGKDEHRGTEYTEVNREKPINVKERAGTSTDLVFFE